MGQGEVAISIDKPAVDVWAVVGDFGGLAAWSPGMDSCEVDGDTRTIKMMGMEVVERLLSRDEAGRTYTYSVIAGVPVDKHQATITVHPDGSRSRVTWAFQVEPESMTEAMHGVYDGALTALKTHVEA